MHVSGLKGLFLFAISLTFICQLSYLQSSAATLISPTNPHTNISYHGIFRRYVSTQLHFPPSLRRIPVISRTSAPFTALRLLGPFTSLKVGALGGSISNTGTQSLSEISLIARILIIGKNHIVLDARGRLLHYVTCSYFVLYRR